MSRPHSRKSTLVIFSVCAALIVGCAGFKFPIQNGGGGGQAALRPDPPNISVANVTLAESPDNRQLAAYFCSQHAPIPMICNAIGPVPGVNDLKFAFDLELDVQNPNQIALPLVQALVAFTAYPGEGEQNLGALCTSFCEDPSNCAQDAADACQSDEPEINDMQSFATAAAGFLIRAATGQVNMEDLRVKTVAPGETIRVVIRLQVNPLQMVNLIQRTGQDTIEQAKRGRTPSFTIPYSIEGSAWVSVQNFGRIAVNFGPMTGEWDLPTGR